MSILAIGCLCCLACVPFLLYFFAIYPHYAEGRKKKNNNNNKSGSKPAPIATKKREAADECNYSAAARRFRDALPPRTGKRYLIVGCGFVGSHILETLIEIRKESGVSVCDVNFSAKSKWTHDERVHRILCDITDEAQVMDMFAKGHFDVVINTAAYLSFHHRLDHQYQASYNVNVAGVRNLLAAAERCGTVLCFIHISTTNVVQDCRNTSTFHYDEKSAYATDPTINFYTKTKILGEEVVREFAAKSLRSDGTTRVMRVGIVRPGCQVFGANDNFHLQRIIASNTIVSISGVAHVVSDYVYVKNVVLVILLLEKHLLSTAATGATGDGDDDVVFNATNDDPMSLDDWNRTIKRLLEAKRRARVRQQTIPFVLAFVLSHLSGKP